MTDSENNRTSYESNHVFPFLAFCLTAILLVIIITRAWISEDAYITFRTVDNLLQGYGLTWNIAERVQAYTHPLWMILIAFFTIFSKEQYFTTIILSVGFTLFSLIVYVYFPARNKSAILLGLFALVCSNAFVDYATSGLENPLCYFLLALFYFFYLKMPPRPKKNLWLTGILALLAITRMDALLLCLPAWLVLLLENHSRKAVRYAILGWIPFLLWEVFSIIYYGFPFPNTAYAKLYTGIPEKNLLMQGATYFINSIRTDPVTLIVIFISTGLGIFSRKKAPLVTSLGVLLYLFYILKIGGDFMSGRFFALPLFIAVLLLAQLDTPGISHPIGILPFLLLGILNISGPISTFQLWVTAPSSLALVDQNGIVNERVFYQDTNSVFFYKSGMVFPENADCKIGAADSFNDNRVVMEDNIGILGYCAGPNLHIVDEYALAEPLLARLPITTETWRIGHFRRDLPEGYLDSLESGKNKIIESDIAEYYDKLSIITRGKLWEGKRIMEIWKMNTGAYDSLISGNKRYARRIIPLASEELLAGVIIPNQGITIDLEDNWMKPFIQIGLDYNDEYRVDLFRDTWKVFSKTVRVDPASALKSRTVNISVPASVQKNGYNRIDLTPLYGDNSYSLTLINITDDPAITTGAYPLAMVSEIKPAGTSWDAEGNIIFSMNGILIDLGQVRQAAGIEVSLDHNDIYQLQVLLDDNVEYETTIPKTALDVPGLRIETIAVPESVQKTGYDHIRITPISGDELYSFGHLRLLP